MPKRRRRRRRGRTSSRDRRRILVAVALGLFGLLALTLRDEEPPANAGDLCSVFRERLSWYDDSRSVSRRWRVGEPLIVAILHQESSLRADARPPRRRLLGFIPWRRPSTAYGYAQVVDATWRQFESELGRGASRRRFADAAEFVGWYVSELAELLDLRRDDAEAVYLAYHEGPGGFARGSHRGKPSLLRSAARVADRAERYADQLEGCRDELDRSLRARTIRRVLTMLGLGIVLVLLVRWRWRWRSAG